MLKARSRLVWLLLPFLAIGPLLWSFNREKGLLQDTDTKVLLAVIRETQNPLAWFTGDWPLKNHFYRPISTLVFEADQALYGTNAGGYGFTNALLCSVCILLLFWLVREVLDDWPMAGLSSLIFGLWHFGSPPDVRVMGWVLVGVALASLSGLRHGKEKRWTVLALVGACLFLMGSYGPIYDLRFRVVDWIPGRTATVMTVFCLAAVASYARWERLTAPRRQPAPPTATDRPLRAEGPTPKLGGPKMAWGWAAGSFLFLILALGSYEQAIMLPAILLGTAILMAFSGLKPRWGLHAGYWAILVGYLVLRSRIVPQATSGYQAQQFRDGPGVLIDVFRYLFPPVNDVQSLITVASDPLIILTNGFWSPVIGILGCSALIWVAVKDEKKWVILGLHLMAFFAFLPMAWFKMFEHYHYWSGAYRAVFLTATVALILRAATAAVSPRGIQAPPRSDPAPGSLPHPYSSPPAS